MLVILSQRLGNDPNLNKLVNGASKQLLCDRKVTLDYQEDDKIQIWILAGESGHTHKESRASLWLSW